MVPCGIVFRRRRFQWELSKMSDTPIASPQLADLPEARRLFAVGRTKLNDLCNAGDLNRLHIGRKAVITMESILAFIASLKKKG